jgi:hypothetical protein
MISEILEFSKQLYMAPWTILFIVSSIITILSLVSGIGTDIDFDADVDVDFDTDIDLDTHVDADSILKSFYIFLNVGKVPVTVIIFTFITINWTLGIFSNFALNTSHNAFIGFIILAVIFILSIPLTKLLTNPLKMLFTSMIEEKESLTQIRGGLCTTLTEVTEKNGQASIKDGPTIVNLMVCSEKGKTISKGKKAVVLKKNSSSNRYIISEVEDEIFK